MTLLDFFSLLKRRLKWVVIVPIVCCVIGLGIGFLTPEEYETAASLNVSDEPTSADNIAKQNAQEKADETGFEVIAATNTSTRVVRVTVIGSSPDDIQRVANEVVEQTKTDIDSVFADSVTTTIISQANSTTNNSTSPVLLGLVGLLAGLFIVVCVVVIHATFKGLILNPREVEEQYELKFLGKVSPAKPENTTKTLLANVQFTGNNAKRFCIVPVGNKDCANVAAQELAELFKGINQTVKLDKSYSAGDLSDDAAEGAAITLVTVPSVESSAKASYAAHNADAVILILEDEHSTYKQLDTAVHELLIAKANIIGFVIVA